MEAWRTVNGNGVVCNHDFPHTPSPV
uniref:Uncharacterized protein n=1 Tax=Anguilla anguilla TaxID=7936 RepID=A0A0E9QFF2_ANGAN